MKSISVLRLLSIALLKTQVRPKTTHYPSVLPVIVSIQQSEMESVIIFSPLTQGDSRSSQSLVQPRINS